MATKTRTPNSALRRANIRLAVLLGLAALGFYLFMIFSGLQ